MTPPRALEAGRPFPAPSRRAFAVGIAGLLLAPAARAQPFARRLRLGVLRPTELEPADRSAALLLHSLRRLGYRTGRNLAVENRHADGREERLPALARELVRHRVDVIVAVGSAATRAARDATTTIPIVMVGDFDPIAVGLVSSLERPGANLTGVLVGSGAGLAARRLALLREALPEATRFGLIVPADPALRPEVAGAQRAAAAQGVALSVAEVEGRGDYERVFNTFDSEQVQAVLVGASTAFLHDRRRLLALAARHRLPTAWEWPEEARDGGLLAYGVGLDEAWQQVAAYVDRLSRGARAGDLPIVRPTRLRLVVNLRTARALDLALPDTLLSRADEVIE